MSVGGDAGANIFETSSSGLPTAPDQYGVGPHEYDATRWTRFLWQTCWLTAALRCLPHMLSNPSTKRAFLIVNQPGLRWTGRGKLLVVLADNLDVDLNARRTWLLKALQVPSPIVKNSPTNLVRSGVIASHQDLSNAVKLGESNDLELNIYMHRSSAYLFPDQKHQSNRKRMQGRTLSDSEPKLDDGRDTLELGWCGQPHAAGRA